MWFAYKEAAVSGKREDIDQYWKDGTAFERQGKAKQALLDAGIFRHKYHFRTKWELSDISEVAEMKRFQPYKILAEGD